RISAIQDIRPASGNAYNFTYTSGHLSSIAATIPTGENYTLGYTASTLRTPFDPALNKGSVTLLNSVTVSSITALHHDFTYDVDGAGKTAGELAKVIFPYRGELRWEYQSSAAYPNGQILREVQYRKLVKETGATPKTYALSFDQSGANPIH